MTALPRLSIIILATILALAGCETKTKLIYISLDNRLDKGGSALQWKEQGSRLPCSHWRWTNKKEGADYQLFVDKEDFTEPKENNLKENKSWVIKDFEVLTIIDRRGKILYKDSSYALISPYGSSSGGDASNICRLTGEWFERIQEENW